MTITVVNKIFIDDYRDLQAPKTRVLIAELTEKLVPFFKGLYDDSFEGIIIISLFNGSVGVNFELSLKPSSNVTNTTVVEALTKGNGTQALGFLELGEISAVEQIQPTTQVTEMISPTPSALDSPLLETWEIVLIVAAIIVFLLLIIIVILVVKYRRNSKSGKEMIAFDGYWELRADAKYKNNQPPLRASQPSYTNGIYSNGTPTSLPGRNGRVEDSFINEAYI